MKHLGVKSDDNKIEQKKKLQKSKTKVFGLWTMQNFDGCWPISNASVNHIIKDKTLNNNCLCSLFIA